MSGLRAVWRGLVRSTAKCRKNRGGLRSWRLSGAGETLESRYALSTNPVGFDVVPANQTTPLWVMVGGMRANAVNFSGDHDWYRVWMDAGMTYRLRLDGTINGLFVPGLSDPVLTLRNSSGVQVAFNDDANGSRNSEIRFTAAISGTYYADVGGFAQETGGYTLYAATAATPDDYAGNVFTSGSVAVGGTASGVVGVPGDRDWFRVALVAGRRYRFDLSGVSLADPQLNLRSGFGLLLDSNDDYQGLGRNSRIFFRPTSSGIYHLDVGGFGSGVGSYTLRVSTA